MPGDVVKAAVAVLAAWAWTGRPGAVIHLPSRSRPELIATLAGRLAEIGRLPLLGPLTVLRDPSGGHGSNSAQRLRAVHSAFAVPAGMQARLDGSPVLLVDDQVESGWTMTETARLLREAGAGPVLPFALATVT